MIKLQIYIPNGVNFFLKNQCSSRVEDWKYSINCPCLRSSLQIENEASSNVLKTLRRLLALCESEGGVDRSLGDLATADDQGNTVVHWAARLGCCRSLRRMLTNNVVSLPNRSGVTPLHVAADRGNRDDVEVVIVFCICVINVYKRFFNFF